MGVFYRSSQLPPPAAAEPSAQPVAQPAAQPAGKPLQAKTYQEPAKATTSPSKAPKVVAKSTKKEKSKGKGKKGSKSAAKPVNLPDGIEISWRKPPPPDEVAEAMKFLKPNANKLNQKKEEPANDVAVPESLVSCPFCRGQFADFSEHMDHCPVITGGGDPSI